MRHLLRWLIPILLLGATGKFAVAQGGTYDPTLIAKIKTGKFGQIERGRSSAQGLAAMLLAFNDKACAATTTAKISQWETIYIYRGLAAESGLSDAMARLHPTYAQVVDMIDSDGCKSHSVQSLMVNGREYLRRRYNGSAVTDQEVAARRATALTRSEARPYARTPIREEEIYPQIPGIRDFRTRSDAQILVCSYGYASVYFWSERVWYSKKELSSLHPEHPLLSLPEKVVERCPTTLGSASDIR